MLPIKGMKKARRPLKFVGIEAVRLLNESCPGLLEWVLELVETDVVEVDLPAPEARQTGLAALCAWCSKVA